MVDDVILLARPFRMFPYRYAEGYVWRRYIWDIGVPNGSMRKHCGFRHNRFPILKSRIWSGRADKEELQYVYEPLFKRLVGIIQIRAAHHIASRKRIGCVQSDDLPVSATKSRLIKQGPFGLYRSQHRINLRPKAKNPGSQIPIFLWQEVFDSLWPQASWQKRNFPSHPLSQNFRNSPNSIDPVRLIRTRYYYR